MPEEKKLRFLPRGTALVPHYESQTAGMRRFHGWKYDPSLGPSYEEKVDQKTKVTRNHGGFVKRVGLENVIEVPATTQFRAEYVRHLRDGDLWPADEFTAQQAGVKFDPSFGGEHDSATPISLKTAPRAEEH